MSARSKKPTSRGTGAPPNTDEQETIVYDSGQHRRAQSPPIQAISKKETSAPIQAISMKTPGDARPEQAVNPPTPALPRPKLRAVSEVKPAAQAQNLGNLAPPYDPNAARARSMQDYVVWGCVAVILASGIALIVWFLAR